MEKEVILKRTLFGGFNRRGVMEYINALQKESSENRIQLEELKSLRVRVDTLEVEVKQKDLRIDELTKLVYDANGRLRMHNASDTLIKGSVAYADGYIESARIAAQVISRKTTEQVENAKIQIDVMMDWLGGISDSVLELYSSLSELKTEYDTFKSDFDKLVIVKKTERKAENEKPTTTEEETPMRNYSEQDIQKVVENKKNVVELLFKHNESDYEADNGYRTAEAPYKETTEVVSEKADVQKEDFASVTTNMPKRSHNNNVIKFTDDSIDNEPAEDVKAVADDQEEDNSSIPDENTIALMRETEKKYRNMLR